MRRLPLPLVFISFRCIRDSSDAFIFTTNAGCKIYGRGGSSNNARISFSQDFSSLSLAITDTSRFISAIFPLF